MYAKFSIGYTTLYVCMCVNKISGSWSAKIDNRIDSGLVFLLKMITV